MQILYVLCYGKFQAVWITLKLITSDLFAAVACLINCNHFCYRPAVCLTVCGPGLLHTVGGMANANENGW